MEKASTVFEQIYQLTYDKVAFYVLSKCGTISEVEDILQDVYTELYKVLSDKGVVYLSAPEGFVMHLAKSKVFQYYSKKERKQAGIYVDSLIISDAEKSNETAPEVEIENWEDVLIDKLTADEVMAYLARKDELTKEIFYQHYFQDKTLKEIAEICGVKESTIKSRLYRTLKELRKLGNLLCVLLIIGVLGACLHVFVWKKENSKQDEAVPTAKPTMCPMSAIPTIRINGKLYRVELIGKNDAAYDIEKFIGSVESTVELDKTPTQEMESNILPAGALIYQFRYSDSIYIAIVIEDDEEIYYRLLEVK